MSSLTASHVPRDIDDAAVRAALQAEFAFAERLRTAILSWLALVLAGLFVVLEAAVVFGASLPMKPSRAGESIAVSAAVLIAALQFAIGRWAIAQDDARTRSAIWYAGAVLEVVLIVGAWALVSTTTLPVRTAVPGLIAFNALVLLSALRLDWRLTIFTTVLAAASHAYLHARFITLVSTAAVRPRIFDSLVSLLVIGALTALVAEQARRRTVNAIRAIRQSQALQRQIIDAEDAARSRLGRDLHDGLGGHLSGIAMLAQALARRAEAGASTSSESLRELAELSLAGVEEVRRLAHGLDPAPVESGLEDALRRLADRTTAGGTQCTFTVDGHAAAIDDSVTLQLYHIAHEATTNAVRHGAPSRIDVRLTVRPGTLTLDVRDDGTGIADTPSAGLGLRTMAKRTELIGGVLRLRRGPGGGTVMSCVVPR